MQYANFFSQLFAQFADIPRFAAHVFLVCQTSKIGKMGIHIPRGWCVYCALVCRGLVIGYSQMEMRKGVFCYIFLVYGWYGLQCRIRYITVFYNPTQSCNGLLWSIKNSLYFFGLSLRSYQKLGSLCGQFQKIRQKNSLFFLCFQFRVSCKIAQKIVITWSIPFTFMYLLKILTVLLILLNFSFFYFYKILILIIKKSRSVFTHNPLVHSSSLCGPTI